MSDLHITMGCIHPRMFVAWGTVCLLMCLSKWAVRLLPSDHPCRVFHESVVNTGAWSMHDLTGGAYAPEAAVTSPDDDQLTARPSTA